MPLSDGLPILLTPWRNTKSPRKHKFVHTSVPVIIIMSGVTHHRTGIISRVIDGDSEATHLKEERADLSVDRNGLKTSE